MKFGKMYMGTMFSGKSYALLCAVNHAVRSGLKVGVFEHPANTRNSSRDMANLCSTSKYDSQRILACQWDLLVFDELHFYECFTDVAMDCFLLTLGKCAAKNIILAGLEYDFYSGLARFKIWQRVLDAGIFDAVEYCPLYSPSPCHFCGTWRAVHYTANVNPMLGRVGDHYANCCLACATLQYEQYVEVSV